MKKAAGLFAATLFLSIGIAAFAHGPGLYGQRSAYGYGEAMKGYAYCCKVADQKGGYGKVSKGTMNDIRRELNQTHIEYMQAFRYPGTDGETLSNLEMEIMGLHRMLNIELQRPASKFEGPPNELISF
jgi:hypothetical protein